MGCGACGWWGVNLVWMAWASSDAIIAMNTSSKGFGPARHFVPSTMEFGLEEGLETKFRLLSWNLLAPSWDDLAPRKSDWHFRWPRILQEILVRAPDILVLQEVEVLIYDEQIEPFFKARGYKSVHTGHECGVGLAVFWRVSKFELKTATDFELTSTKLTPWRSILDNSFNSQQRKRYATQHNTVLFVILTRVGERKRSDGFLIGAVHLKANPRLHKPLRLDIQLFEANVLLDVLTEVVRRERTKYSSLSCILAGDFNAPHFYPDSVFQSMSRHIANPAEPWKPAWDDLTPPLPSPVYELLTKGNLTAESMGFLMTAIKAAGLHPSILLQGGGANCRSKSTLDFVFFGADHSESARLVALGSYFEGKQLKTDSHLNSASNEYSEEELKLATNDFDRKGLLGSGSFGKVYKGTMKDGTEVLQVPNEGGFEDEVTAELTPVGVGLVVSLRQVRVLSRFRHPNLVILMGFARFLAGGDAAKRIAHSRHALKPFSARARVSCALDAACGLSHLHNMTPRCIAAQGAEGWWNSGLCLS
eukprot:Skav217186  [mRNA]  locus=scaffold557:26080:33761:+ [translate_table: standard]